MSLAFIIASCMNPVQKEADSQSSTSDMKRILNSPEFSVQVARMYMFAGVESNSIIVLENPLVSDMLDDAASAIGMKAKSYLSADLSDMGEENLVGRIVGLDSIPFYNMMCIATSQLANALSYVREGNPAEFYENLNEIFKDCADLTGDDEAQSYEMFYKLFVSRWDDVDDIVAGWVFSDIHPSQIKRGNSGEYLANVNYKIPGGYFDEFSYPTPNRVNNMAWAYGEVINDQDIDPCLANPFGPGCATVCLVDGIKNDVCCDNNPGAEGCGTTSILERPRVIPGQNGWERQ